MSIWVLPSDLLATSRFTVSPMVETVAALRVLHQPRTPWERAWRRPHVDAYRELLADPALRALPDAAFAPRWTADFLSIAPADAAPTFGAELAAVAALPDERMRADLRVTRPGPLPEPLLRPGLTDRVVELLSWVWNRAVAPEWPERDRRLRADIVARTARLSADGWAGVFADLTGEMRWLGEGRLRVNDYPAPARALDRAEQLFFIPTTHARSGWVVWDQPTRFGVVYPARGILAESPPAVPGGLVRLIGANRAEILARLEHPLSTSHLVALTGLSLGTVSDHLRVLLDAGAVTKRRSGREVLYWRTPLGASLVRTGD
ncbi:ArsR/SmtB family transcription factor [Plantactinospora siamensis]|uniref:ArsR/SmtB family transcription factor n=1 Tax=Plantactinospora siamensis TaxID=555372 RepID=A0ABV6NYW0_9ACTN